MDDNHNGNDTTPGAVEADSITLTRAELEAMRKAERDSAFAAARRAFDVRAKIIGSVSRTVAAAMIASRTQKTEQPPTTDAALDFERKRADLMSMSLVSASRRNRKR